MTKWDKTHSDTSPELHLMQKTNLNSTALYPEMSSESHIAPNTTWHII